MTALSEYERLEALGLYTPGETAQRRNVILSIGDASLVIADPRGVALAHWSLAAVERLNPGQRPASFAPAADADERVETDDEEMTRAIEKVRRAVRRARPRASTVRGPLIAAALLAVAVAAAWWLPGAITRHAVAILPDAARQQLGATLLDQVEALTGPACGGPQDLAALEALVAALAPVGPEAARVMPAAIPGALALPGGTVLLNRALVESHDSPQVAAGYLLAATHPARDPVLDVLDHAGLAATIRLMTTGRLPPEALSGWAEAQLARGYRPVRDRSLLRLFAAAGVPAAPWARAALGTGAETLTGADPVAPGDAAPLLADGQWVALQSICE